MKSLLLLSGLLASLAVAGCGSKDEPVPDPAMPPAASKEAGESRASASGGAQFGRSSDKADGG